MKIKQLLLPIITASLLLIGVSAFKQTQISETRAARIDGDIDYVHSVKLTDESKTWKDGDAFTLADLTVDLTMYGYGRETHTADKIGNCTDGQYKCSFSDESIITSITLSEGINKLTLHFLLGGFNCYGDFDKQVDVVASAATFTAEDLAKEFNGAMELNCDSNGNTSAANLANIKTAWKTAAEQYESLDSDEKAKFSGSSSGSPAGIITDLTGYTWVGNDDMEYPEDYSYFINFESNGEDFNEFYFGSGNDFCIGYLNRDENLYEFPYLFYFDVKWQNEVYRTINILGGTDATNVNFITWLQANGTLSKSINPDIEHMLLKYDYIYTKYGESLELENFLQRDLAPLSVKINNFNFGDKSESTWIVAVVVIAGLTAIGGCFFYRKRKQY